MVQDLGPFNSSYIQELSRYPLLTPEREKKLLNILSSDDHEDVKKGAREEMIVSNLRLAFYVAKSFYQKFGNNPSIKMEAMDYIAEANRGLMKAVEGFNVEGRANKFSSYAVHAIRTEIIRAITHAHFIKLPPHHYKFYSKMRELEKEYGEDLTDEILLKELDIGGVLLSNIKYSQATKLTSVDMDVLLRVVSEDDTPIKVMMRNDLKEYLLEKMEALTERERDVIFNVFFNRKSVQDKALLEKYGVTRQALSNFYKAGLKKLRFYIERDKRRSEKTKGKIKNEREHRQNAKWGNEQSSGLVQLACLDLQKPNGTVIGKQTEPEPKPFRTKRTWKNTKDIPFIRELYRLYKGNKDDLKKG